MTRGRREMVREGWNELMRKVKIKRGKGKRRKSGRAKKIGRGREREGKN